MAASTSPSPAPPPASAPAALAPAPGEAVLVPGRLAEAGGVVSGLLYFAAFAGLDVWPLTFICLIPLYLSLFGQRPKRAAFIALLAGLAMNLAGFYWLLNMLRTFSGFPTALCLVFVVIICAYQGGRFAMLGWLHARAAARGWPAWVVFTGAFVASELVYPLLFPWYYATTVHTVPLLMQLADIGGPYLVGVFLVLVNLGLAEPLRAILAAKAGEPGGRNRRVVAAGMIALAVALAYGVVRTRMVASNIAAAEQVRVGYVQGNMGLMQKREDPGEGLRRHRRLTTDLRAKGVDLVVWSESAVTFSVPEELGMKGHFFRDRFAASLGVPTIFGAVLFRVDPDRERWFNTAIATDARGEVTGRYDKQYLLAFGEYLPFGDTFPALYRMSPHSGRFSKGTSLDPVSVDIKGTKHTVSVLVCYEDILPSFVNQMVAHADPELLVNITNDAWFGDTTEPYEHLALAKLRAVEHRRYLIRSTNTGVSAIVDPLGNVLTSSHTFVAETGDAVVRWMRGKTVYEVLGDLPWWIIAALTLVAGFRPRRKTA